MSLMHQWKPRIYRKALLVCLASLPCAVLRAETMYVTDTLRLGIHHTEDTSDEAFRNLVSGAELEIIERVPNYAHVRTTDGEEGWVKSAYLVSEKPAKTRVAELEQELKSVLAELKETQAALEATQSEARQLGRQAAATDDSADAIQETLERLKTENDAYAAQLDRYRGSLPLVWVAGALGVTLLAGFLGGLWWLDARIRRRHGGFRIY
jgi:SH3 domain protein